jgi:hypothetical protein
MKPLLLLVKTCMSKLCLRFKNPLAYSAGSVNSFEHGASLSRIVNEVGRAVWGDKFSQYAAEQQRRAVLKYLQSQPCLLIWDNFEPVAGFPEGK